MQFKQPELLYALVLLVIPIIVHLFQLRKFQKQEFTNVEFLQRVILQTRKSSVIKKWLTLLARMLALACIIIAFAQPFTTTSDVATKPQETVIYLDNSFSMQAKGPRGELLKRAVQELLETLPKTEVFTLLTNNERFRNISLESNRNDLQQLDYTSEQLDFKTAFLRAKNEFSDRKETIKNFIAISDFQLHNNSLAIEDNEITTHLIQLQPVNTKNVSVDSVFISNQNSNGLSLTAKVSSSNSLSGAFPISLYNDDLLLAKTSVELNENNIGFAEFNVPDLQSFSGSVRVEDAGLQFDNTYYFSINEPEPINVVAISTGNDAFLKKLYNNPKEFNLSLYKENSIDYNALNTANTLILNELNKIPSGLTEIASKLVRNGGTVIIIPGETKENTSYTPFLNTLNLASLNTAIKQEKQITNIAFDHPLYKEVFNSRINNFQYPVVQSSYALKSSGNSVLSYADNSPFLLEKNGIYLFSAPLNSTNSNFKNAPLIVPTFYNIAKQSLKTGVLGFTIGDSQSTDIPVSLNKDGVLSISNRQSSFIPLQQNFNSKVQLNFKELPELAGNYIVKAQSKELKKISFNYTRTESKLNYHDISTTTAASVNDQVSSFFEELQEQNSLSQLWKWFVIFALLFLVIELLLLKYLK